MLKYKKLSEDAYDISQAYNSPGYDFYNSKGCALPPFYSSCESEWIYTCSLNELIDSSEFPKLGTKVKTDIGVEIPPGYVGIFRDRSSIGTNGIIVVAGVIDPDYRGEVQVCLINLNPREVVLPPGTKIAQMLVVPCLIGLEEVDCLSDTIRGDKGFGSSGI